jgi:hypothetical protein
LRPELEAGDALLAHLEEIEGAVDATVAQPDLEHGHEPWRLGQKDLDLRPRSVLGDVPHVVLPDGLTPDDLVAAGPGDERRLGEQVGRRRVPSRHAGEELGQQLAAGALGVCHIMRVHRSPPGA